MLGGSLAQEHDHRIVDSRRPSPARCIAGGILGWSLNYFFHFAQRTGPLTSKTLTRC